MRTKWKNKCPSVVSFEWGSSAQLPSQTFLFICAAREQEEEQEAFASEAREEKLHLKRN